MHHQTHQYKLTVSIILFAVMFVFSQAMVIRSQGSLYQEAPMLASLVKVGKLPSVDNRLPATPLIVEPERSVGVYGGAWHFGMLKVGDTGSFLRTLGYEGLLRWDPQWLRIIPNVAQRYEISKDARTIRFDLRKGMRWSDGEPFTSADIVFWYQDLLSKAIVSDVDGLIKHGVAVVAVDDYTTEFRFEKPYSTYIDYLATIDGRDPVRYPAHYLKQFHADYNPNVDKLVAAAGVKDWKALLVANADYTKNPDLPTLFPWILTKAYPTQDGEIVAVRNPYYWKIDTNFNQLPYLDTVVYHQFANTNEIPKWAATSGQLGAQDRYIGTRQNLAYFQENAKQGKYSFYTLTPAFSNSIMIALNWNAKDPALSALIQDLNFRRGLSVAIDRKKIVDTILDGKGQPYQIAPRPESPFYNERLATQYTTYDVALANSYLDQAGVVKRDSEGFRLLSNGQRIDLPFIISDLNVDYPAIMKAVFEYWKAVGIQASLTVTTREKARPIIVSGDYVGTTWDADGGIDVLLEPRYYVAGLSDSLYYVPKWWNWVQDPKSQYAEKPPEKIIKAMNLLNEQINQTTDPEEQAAIMKQILDFAADQFYVMGISLAQPTYGLVADNFHNVPSVFPLAYRYPSPAPTNPEQYYIDPQ